MKFGVREICDVVLKAKSATTIGSHTFQQGEPVIYFDTAKTSSMESASTTVYAQGGKGNNRLIAWEGEKTLTFTMEDALISPKGLAILSGADLLQAGNAIPNSENKVKITTHVTEVIPINSTNLTSITVANTIATGTDVYVMLLDGNGEMSGIPMKCTGSAKAVTVGSNILKDKDTVLVDYYTEKETDAMQIDITPDKFAGYYYLEASTLFRRESDGKDLPAEFIIPKVKIQSNFTFSMSSSGDPSSFTFTMDAFPDYIVGNKTKKVLASIQVLDADDNYDLTGTTTEDAITYKRFNYNKDTSGSYFGADTKPLTSDDTPYAGK